MDNENKSSKTGMATGNEERPDQPVNEKTSIGGQHNSGVTSADPQEKEQIEKQATMGKNQPGSGGNKQQQGQQNQQQSPQTQKGQQGQQGQQSQQGQQGQQSQQGIPGETLTEENLPEATNESTGKTGSGQRQDSN